MPVSPLSTPLKTEYKPLGLEMFAQPLSDMQAKYDTAKAAINDTTYEISRLSQDDARGAELIKELDEKTSKLAQELIATGNYRQAAEQLKKLNKSFSQDPETKAVISNYDAYKKAAEEQKKQLEKGKITQTDFDTWDFKTRNQFKGTGYDPATGNYTSINTRPPEENREKEIEDLSLKIAGMRPEDGYQTIQNLGIQGINQTELKKAYTYRDLGQVQKEIYNFLATSDRFREFVDDRGQRDFYYSNENAKMRGKGQEFQDGLVNSVVGNIDNNIRNIADAKKKDPSKAKEYDEILTNLNTQKNSIIAGYNQAKQTNSTDQFAEKLFIEDKRKHFDRISLAAADVVDFNKETVDLSYREDAALKAKRDSGVKKFEEVQNIVTNVTSADVNNKIFTGDSTFVQSENKNAKVLAQTSGDILQAIWKTEESIVPEKMEQLGLGAGLVQTKKNLATVKVFGDFQEDYKKNTVNLDNKIADLTNKLSRAANQAEKDMLKAEIDGLQTSKVSASIAYTSQEKTLQNIIDTEVSKSTDPEIKKLYEQYASNPIGLLAALNKTDKTAAEKANVIYEEQNKVNLAKVEALAEERERRKLDPNYEPEAPNLSKEQYVKMKLKELESASTVANTAVSAALASTSSEESKLLTKITNDYRTLVGFQTGGYAVSPIEVVVNKSAIAFTNKTLEDANKWVQQNSTGSSPARRVTVNAKTGESKLQENFGRYDMRAYKIEEPHYVGVDQNGAYIMRYTVKDEYAGDKSKVGTAVANFIRTNKQGQADPNSLPDSQVVIPTSEINQWLKDNPEDLYVKIDGTNIDIVNSTQDSYEELMLTAETFPGNEGKEMMTTVINNFAPLHLINSPSRKEAYSRAAASLQDAVDNNETKVMQEGPAIWQDNGNGTATGYLLQYTVKNREIHVVPYTIIKNSDGTLRAPEMVPGAASTLNAGYQNLPIALLKMNLIYGTGRKEDIVNVTQGFEEAPFVPAFTTAFKGVPANSVIPVGGTIR
jgi:hypothetical protein